MTYITKCTKEDCPRKNQCYRYTCEESEHCNNKAEFYGGENCKLFWDSSEYEEMEKTTKILRWMVIGFVSFCILSVIIVLNFIKYYNDGYYEDVIQKTIQEESCIKFIQNN